MPRIRCDVLSRATGRPIVGGTSEWSAVYAEAAISAALHDMTKHNQENNVPESYVRHLSDWLNSGDDITIMTLFNGEEMDVWQYDDERD